MKCSVFEWSAIRRRYSSANSRLTETADGESTQDGDYYTAILYVGLSGGSPGNRTSTGTRSGVSVASLRQPKCVTVPSSQV